MTKTSNGGANAIRNRRSTVPDRAAESRRAPKRGAKTKVTKAIGAWRRRKKLSQSQAALRLRVPLRTLQHWEQGRMQPGPWRWQLIERALR